MKRPKVVTTNLHGAQGIGRNLAEAKKDAISRIEKAFEGMYTPEIFSHRGYAVLIYREPNGWSMRTICTPEDGMMNGKVWGTGTYDSLNAAKKSALNHLAQLGWIPEDGDTAPEFLSGQDVSDFRSWTEFQLRYREATVKGLKDWDAHAYASRNPWRTELWASKTT